MSGDRTPWDALSRAVRLVRRRALASVLLVVLAVPPGTMLLAWMVGERWPHRSAAPLLLIGVGAACMGALALLLVRRWVRPIDEAQVAAAAERRRGLADGTLRGVLELGRELPRGASAALYRQTERWVATALSGATPDELAGDLGARTRSRGRVLTALVGGLVLATTAAAFATPERARAGWEPLLHPVVHLRGEPLPPLVVEPGDAEVPRGRLLEVTIRAPGRSQVTVQWQGVGDVPRERRLAVDEGHAAVELGPVETEVRYRVRSPDGAASRTYRATPVDPLLVSGLTLDLVYPVHVGRASERIEGEPGPLAVPEGTILRIRGQATRSIDGATLRRSDGADYELRTDGHAFAAEWTPRRRDGGAWSLHLRGPDGSDVVAATVDVEVVRDEPPIVRVLTPHDDAELGPDRRQAVVAEAVDDHGITAAELVYRRLGPRGERGEAVRARLPVEEDEAGRVVLRTVLDASREPLVPGDAVEYWVAVRDNSPAGQVGRSPTQVLRLPRRTDLRERARSEADALQRSVGAAMEASRDLARRARELERRTAAGSRPNPVRGAGSRAPEQGALDARRAGEARQLAAAQEEAADRLDALRAQLARLEAMLDEAGLRDADLARRMDQAREAYEELASADRRRDADAVRAAADALDPEALAEALERLTADQQALAEALEQSLARLEAAALDQEMQALAREAEEIANEQEALAAAMRQDMPGPGEASGEGRERPGQPVPDGGVEGAMGTVDPDTAAGGAAEPERAGAEPGEAAGREDGERPAGTDDRGDEDGEAGGGEEGGDREGSEERARRQDDLADRTGRLNDLLSALQQQLLERGDPESASQAGSAEDQGRSAQGSMEQAAEAARQDRGEDAAQSGEEAASQMAGAARALDEARRQRTEEGRRAAEGAVQQATQEALRLAEREESLRQQMEAAQGSSPGGGDGEGVRQMQSEQAAVRRGLEQLGRNLMEANQRTGAADRDVSQALARAMLDLDSVLEGLESGAMPVRQAGRAVESLNRLAMELLEQGMRGQGRAAIPEQVLERLSEAAQEQGALNAQVGAFVPLDLPSAARSEQLQQLAEQQRGIARRVGELSGMVGGREDVLGRLDQLAGESAELARELEGGRVDGDVRARQDRLFHRLLDAGRTLEREEYTDERLGERAVARERPAPEALDAELLDGSVRYPAPTAAQLQGLPAAYRRMVFEYFNRINAPVAGSTPPGEEGR